MRTLATVLCTSGLKAEAKVARAAGFPVVVGAGNPERTAAMIEAAMAQASCLISFGIAGALAPDLRPGAVVLSGEVIADDRNWRVDRRFHHRIAALAGRIGAREGPVLGSNAILASEAEKMRAWRDTGALAVDTESAAVARVAHEAGVPFLVLRAIADPATRNLPSAALIPLTELGTPSLANVARDVLRRPRQISALLGLAWETRRALLALAAPARALHDFLAAAEPSHRLLDVA